MDYLELSFISYRSKETFNPTGYVLLTITAYFKPLLEFFQTRAAAELLDVITKAHTVLAQAHSLYRALAVRTV